MDRRRDEESRDGIRYGAAVGWIGGWHEPAVPIDDAELDRYLVDQASPIGLLTRVAPAIGLDRSPA